MPRPEATTWTSHLSSFGCSWGWCGTRSHTRQGLSTLVAGTSVARSVSTGRVRSIPAQDPSPSRQVAGRELLSELPGVAWTTEEGRLAELRAQGLEWAVIAAEVGGTPQARRKQLARAASRVARELGLDESDDD